MTIQFQLPIPIPQHFDLWSGPKVPVFYLGVAGVSKQRGTAGKYDGGRRFGTHWIYLGFLLRPCGLVFRETVDH